MSASQASKSETRASLSLSLNSARIFLGLLTLVSFGPPLLKSTKHYLLTLWTAKLSFDHGRLSEIDIEADSP